jgi:hypothetical protein
MPDHHDLLIEALTALITDLVDERMAAFMEANLDTIVQDAIADVPVFEIADYAERGPSLSKARRPWWLSLRRKQDDHEKRS